MHKRNWWKCFKLVHQCHDKVYSSYHSIIFWRGCRKGKEAKEIVTKITASISFFHIKSAYKKWFISRTRHCLNFYQSDTCWKESVKYRRFCFYFTTLIRKSKWGKWGPKTFRQMHLILREQKYFLKISCGTWYSPPVSCSSTCLGWRLVSPSSSINSPLQ